MMRAPKDRMMRAGDYGVRGLQRSPKVRRQAEKRLLPKKTRKASEKKPV